jgi:hypothetical protein
VKVASWIVVTACAGVSGLLLLWGGWLVLTDDPDGGRHPVGAVMVIVAVMSGAVAVGALRRSRRG